MKSIVSMLAVAVIAVGCGGKKEREYSDIERANVFVKELNRVKKSSGEVKYTDQHKLVKAVTLYQDGNKHYIVVLDDTAGRQNYFAVDIRDWNSSWSSKDYLSDETRRNDVFYDLRSNFNGTFTYINRDGSEGPTFSKATVSSNDMRILKAAEEKARKGIIADNLVRLGFRNKAMATEAAKHIYQLNAVMSKRELTMNDLDSMSLRAFNVPYSQAIEAVKVWDNHKINAYSVDAFNAGIGHSPEDAQFIIQGILQGE